LYSNSKCCFVDNWVEHGIVRSSAIAQLLWRWWWWWVDLLKPNG
jgi:hypothetical protein